ncbi:C2H2 type zinc finger transcription factor family [Tasmannia lanceolata]|uniref:C2H2 type zinc finger transcription factor family n=1 Tax=Tasmannia lanceolata TaxID=3420 RepID=UPI0040630013
MGDQRSEVEFRDDVMKEEQSGGVSGERSDDGPVDINRKSMQSNNLKIRIKVPKSNEQRDAKEEEEEEEVIDPTQTKRICQLCNKSFSSGKALGGHMRVHVSETEAQFPNYGKKTHTSKLGFQNNTSNNATDRKLFPHKTDSDNTTCSLCGKTFPSMKSLFGHMRCHPERDWRGIHPPQRNTSSSSSSAVRIWRGINPPAITRNSPASTVTDSIARKTDDQIDSATTMEKSAASLSTWSLTARRGRTPIGLPKAPVKELEEDPVPDAVYNLMMLARGDPLVRSKTERSEESAIENRQNFFSNKAKFYGGDYVSKFRSESETMHMDPKLENTEFNQNSNESESKNTNYNTVIGPQFCNKTEIAKKKKKKRKIRALDSVHGMDSIGIYRCITCNKSFSTHQALGGHRASHKKGKNSSASEEFTLGEDCEDEQAGLTHVDNSLESEQNSLPKAAMPHLCNICNKTFLTGQALGGHKRCHWTGPTEAPTSSITSPEDTAKSGLQPRDFDLNELPTIEDQDLGFPASAYSQAEGV